MSAPLKSGGYIRRTGRALIHKGETIAPAAQTITLTIDGATLGAVALRELQQGRRNMSGHVKFNNGHVSDDTPEGRVVGAAVVGKHDNGNLDLHAAEGDGDAVKLFENVPEGEGGLTFSRD